MTTRLATVSADARAYSHGCAACAAGKAPAYISPSFFVAISRDNVRRLLPQLSCSALLPHCRRDPSFSPLSFHKTLAMTGKRPRSGSPSTTTPADDDIYTSEPILDRQSTFIAHYSPTLHAKALQKLPDLATASHRMAAWRFPSNQRTITANSQQSTRKQLFETGRDDDGEKGGGRALEKLMESMQVTGSVMVARWYGGVMLGPVR